VRDDEHEPGSCDFAIVVADRWQGQGLGEKLMRSLMKAAVDAGIRVVGGITLTENAGMIALARKLGFHVHLEHGNATVTDLRWEAEGAESALIEGSSLPTQPSAPQRGASGSGS